MTPRPTRRGAEQTLLTKTGYHHGNLRSALIEGAVALVRARGVRGFTLSEAARVAGVTSAAPYRHFESREALLACVAERGFEQLRAVLSAADSPMPADPMERLIQLGFRYVEFAVAEPHLFKLMFSREERLSASDSGRAALGLLADTLDAADRAGRLATDAVTAKRAAWGLVHGVAMLRIDGMRTFESDDATDVTTTLRVLLSGLDSTPA